MNELELLRKINQLEERLAYLETLDYSAGWKYLTTPLTSTSWDGDSFSTTAKTKIDLSAVFGVPAGVKAVLVYAYARDSGSAANYALLVLSPISTADAGPFVLECPPVNDRYGYSSGIVPCDSAGDIYYQILASGASTMDVYLEIWGYKMP